MSTEATLVAKTYNPKKRVSVPNPVKKLIDAQVQDRIDRVTAHADKVEHLKDVFFFNGRIRSILRREHLVLFPSH